MSERSSRRRYLQALGVAGTAGLAGCSSPFGDSPNGTDEPLQTAESLPEWTGWVPAEPVTSGEHELLSIDTQRVREEFPDLADDEWDLSELADELGVAEDDISHLVGLMDDSEYEVSVLTGSFDAETIRSNNDFWWFQMDSYQGYTTVDSEMAFGDGVSILGEYEPVLDRRVGETPPLGENDEDWRTFLSTMAGRTIVYATEGTFQSPTGLEPARTGLSVEKVDGTTEATLAYMFDSESEATDVYENRKGRVNAAATGQGGTVQDISLEGKQVIVTIRGNDITF
ncbi:hypothetical protein [Haloarcula salinisoli]|uniref:Uncharacterized protein n=1 Tax=Haloarcula salinisoli TaxID=2487746 RepID=A0A8J7YDE1_9EURY|nr:hypothetical protein [Halomicroarcula salinisoli]MBX0286694.1 hypothetical protein [Halomicroarcula salinisoli]MBX0304005.1 hypothetical protein [Halomicroarcula salinisoli]